MFKKNSKFKINTIIFSYNRAAQLNILLDSIFLHDKSESLVLNIIYKSSNDSFEDGYKKLVSLYPHINWLRENNCSFFEYILIKFSFRNIYRALKSVIGRKSKTNFMHLVKNLLDGEHQLSMFLTDDCIFYREIKIDYKICEKILDTPNVSSYSLRLGENIDGCSKFATKDDYIEWDNVPSLSSQEWYYPFSVDGHIYPTVLLRKIINCIWFSNPSTFESYINDYVKRKAIFKKFYANRLSSLYGFEVNRVQSIYENFSLNLSVNLINKYYLNGYFLFIGYKANGKFRPEIENIIFKKNDHKIVAYRHQA